MTDISNLENIRRINQQIDQGILNPNETTTNALNFFASKILEFCENKITLQPIHALALSTFVLNRAKTEVNQALLELRKTNPEEFRSNEGYKIFTEITSFQIENNKMTLSYNVKASRSSDNMHLAERSGNIIINITAEGEMEVQE